MRNKSEEKEDLYITSQNFEENNDDEMDDNELYPEYLLIKEKEGFLTNTYDEEKEKMLYEQLKTKENFNNKRSYKNIKSLKGKIILTPDFIKNFDENLAKAVEKNKMNKITDKQAKNLYYISDLNVFNSIDILNEKKARLKQIKHQKNKYLNNISLFNYDSKKWKEKRKELNKNINEIMFNKFNKENHKYLNTMSKGIDKTLENAKNIQNNLNIFFGEIDDFIDKQAEYLRENNPPSNSESRIFSKRNSMQKRIKSTKERNDNNK